MRATAGRPRDVGSDILKGEATEKIKTTLKMYLSPDRNG